MTTLRENLIEIFDLYCTSNGASPATISSHVLNGGGEIGRIINGGDVTTGKFERAIHWFDANWPDGAVWPEGLVRPSQLVA